MSRLQIVPPVATIYPNDRQLFLAKAVPPPAMWHTVTDSGDIKSDFSLEVDAAGSQVTGQGAHWLMSGIGVIEFTIDDQCRPTSTGSFVVGVNITDITGVVYSYTLEIKATTVKAFNELAAEIFTQSYSTVSGDVYRLELNAGFSLYRNSVLLHSRVGLATAVGYPMKYNAGIFEPTATAPTRIPGPRLIGDWRISPNIAFTTPSHGNLSVTGLTDRAEYFNGITPGTYTLIAAIEAAADAGNVQRATATIIIPPLQILGQTEVILQPGQKVRFKTNYDAAQTSLITWSVVSGGGSFTQGEYTAASTPGISVVRATADVNDQIADISITVPAVITNASSFTAAKPSEQIDFNSNIPASVLPQLISGGSVATGTGNVIPSIPPGVQEKDILIVLVQSANQNAVISGTFAAVADSPQGIGTAGAGGAVRLSVFWDRWVPGMAAPTITDPGDHAIAQILAIRGCPASGNPWDVTAGNTTTASTAVSIPGDTTTVNNCLILLLVAHATDTASPQASAFTNASLANLVERGDFSAIDGVGGGFAYATGEKATAGAYSATTATLATSSAQGRISIALKPGALVWSASIGSIDSSTGIWTAPSLAGQVAKISATDGLFTVTIEVPVLKLFPYILGEFPYDHSKTVLSSRAEDRSRSSRIKDKDGLAFESFEMKFDNRDQSELLGVLAFHDEHYPDKRFILDDPIRNKRLVGYFDSNIRVEPAAGCNISYAFRFIEG